jgi:hypothetical protein
MDDDPSKTSQHRPSGSGACFDYALEVTRLHARNLEASRAKLGLKKTRSPPKGEPGAEQSRDGEDGNST